MTLSPSFPSSFSDVCIIAFILINIYWILIYNPGLSLSKLFFWTVLKKPLNNPFWEPTKWTKMYVPWIILRFFFLSGFSESLRFRTNILFYGNVCSLSLLRYSYLSPMLFFSQLDCHVPQEQRRLPLAFYALGSPKLSSQKKPDVVTLPGPQECWFVPMNWLTSYLAAVWTRKFGW